MDGEAAVPLPADDAGTPLEQLYAQHVGRAVGLARLLTGDSVAAEDLAQDAFVRLAGRLDALREVDRFDLYLRKTVVNLCRSRARRRAIEAAFLRRFRPEDITPVETPEVRDEVWSAVLRLPYRQRVAVVLRYFEDLPEDRVAEVLGCTTKAVNGMVDRAKATLRTLLSEEDR